MVLQERKVLNDRNLIIDTFRNGIFRLRCDSDAYADACSSNEMMEALMDGLRNLCLKEVELGYDKIWNSGQ